MKVRALFALLMTVFCVSAFAAEVKPTTTITVPLPPSLSLIKVLGPFSSHGLAVTFAMDKTEFEYGGRVSGTYTLKCVGDSGFIVYNPLYNGRTTRPGEVRIFDASGKLVTELMKFRGGSFISGDQQMMVYPGDFLGSHVPGWPYNDSAGGGMLPAGEYKAQFVLYSYVLLGRERVSAPPSVIATESEIEFQRGTKVIAASELVPFKIVAKG